jgi:hypothetical protein
MGSGYLSLNLQLLNLFIGLCKGVVGLPQDFRRLHYQEQAIELRFSNSDGDAVVPELIIASRAVHHTILFEWKSGANTDADQLRRYNGVTQQDLTQRVFLILDQCATHDVTVVGLYENRERLVQGIDNGGYRFPVLAVTDAGLEKIRNQFSAQETDAIFQPTLNIDWERLPMSFFPLDGESEDWEYAEQILPYILTQMERGDPRIVVIDLARQVIPFWDIADRNFRQRIRTKIVGVLDYAERHDFRQYIRRNRQYEGRGGSPAWDVIDNPLFDQPDKRLKIWRTMKRRQADLIAHFRGDEIQEELPLEAVDGPQA